MKIDLKSICHIDIVLFIEFFSKEFSYETQYAKVSGEKSIGVEK